MDNNRDKNKIKQQLQEDERTQQANVIIDRYKTKAELVQYLHVAFFTSPVHIFKIKK